MKLSMWMGGLMLLVAVAGCSASTTNVGSLVLPTSNKTIDVVQHRSDSKECAVGWVIQTYDASGALVDAKSGQGNALHCQLLNATIEAGGRVGAGAVQGAASTVIRNVNQQAQGQLQGQSQTSVNVNSNTNTNTNTAQGGAGGQGGHGNNGGGNGDNDGTNPGTDNHNPGNGDNN